MAHRLYCLAPACIGAAILAGFALAPGKTYSTATLERPVEEIRPPVPPTAVAGAPAGLHFPAAEPTKPPPEPAESTPVVVDFVESPAVSPAAEAKPPEPRPRPPEVRPEPEAKKPVVVKSMHRRSAADIVAMVEKFPSLTLDTTTARVESIQVVRALAADRGNTDLTPALVSRRADLAGLPLLRGAASRVGKASAEHLTTGWMLDNIPPKPLAETLAKGDGWRSQERIPVMMQVLMVNPPVSREVLAKHLGTIEGQHASTALSRMALFDPDAGVRREAVAALAGRPTGEYVGILMRGFSSPWPVTAEHAAESLAALKPAEAVRPLLAVLKGPDPRAPYAKPNAQGLFVRDVVRVNHKLNCLLCHPASFDVRDTPRREVPSLTEPKTVLKKVTGGGTGYGGGGSTVRVRVQPPNVSVRADVTYLRQSYSVLVGRDRYDLLVRERVAQPADVALAEARKSAGDAPHRKAALFALREITGEEGGVGFQNWIRFAREQ